MPSLEFMPMEPRGGKEDYSDHREIQYGPEIHRQLEAGQKPKKAAEVHCRAIPKGNSEVTKGSNLADAATKRAAKSGDFVAGSNFIPTTK